MGFAFLLYCFVLSNGVSAFRNMTLKHISVFLFCLHGCDEILWWDIRIRFYDHTVWSDIMVCTSIFRPECKWILDPKGGTRSRQRPLTTQGNGSGQAGYYDKSPSEWELTAHCITGGDYWGTSSLRFIQVTKEYFLSLSSFGKRWNAKQ